MMARLLCLAYSNALITYSSFRMTLPADRSSYISGGVFQSLPVVILVGENAPKRNAWVSISFLLKTQSVTSFRWVVGISISMLVTYTNVRLLGSCNVSVNMVIILNRLSLFGFQLSRFAKHHQAQPLLYISLPRGLCSQPQW